MLAHRSTRLLVFCMALLGGLLPASGGAPAAAQPPALPLVSSPDDAGEQPLAPPLILAQEIGPDLDLNWELNEAIDRMQDRGGRMEHEDALGALDRLLQRARDLDSRIGDAIWECDESGYKAYSGALKLLADSDHPAVVRAIDDEIVYTTWLRSFAGFDLGIPEASEHEKSRWEATLSYAEYVGRELARSVSAIPPFPKPCRVIVLGGETPVEPREEPQPPALPKPGSAPADQVPEKPPAERVPVDPRIDALSKEAMAAADEMGSAAEACDAERYKEATDRFQAALGQLWSLHEEWRTLTFRRDAIDPVHLHDWERTAVELARLERAWQALPGLGEKCPAEKQIFRIARIIDFTFPYFYPGDITCWEEGVFRVEITAATGDGDELAGGGHYKLNAKVRCQGPSPIVDRGTVQSESEFAVRGRLVGNHLHVEAPQNPATKWTMGWPRDGGWHETTSESQSSVPDAWRIFDAELEGGRYEPFGYGATVTLPFFPPAPGEVTLQTRTLTTIRPLGAAEAEASRAAGTGE